MNKRLYLGAALLISAIGVNAAPVTPQQALQRLSSQKTHRLKGAAQLSKDLLYTYPSVDGEAAVYVFGSLGQQGYILLSADDSQAPLLGYADNGVFDADNMPPQMKEWMDGYARQQEYARQLGLPAYKAPAEDNRKVVAPLMKTTWNQNAPFNMYTPKIGNSQTPTGCVATAMAQVMKYWNYPQSGAGYGSITNPSTGRTETMNLDEDFLWNEMLDSYNGAYTDDQADAVAFLMKACGYSVDMSYTSSVSGSFSIVAAKALMDNFSYNKNIRYYQRDYIEGSEWDEIVYNEVSNGRPVLYGAQSTSGGHEFVCDGYNGDGYYHFNWGWGGMSDGYFILDSLNPNDIGTGGGAGGGFNYKQDIIVGVQPEDEMIYQPRLTQFGELSASSASGKLTLKLSGGGQWLNAGIREISNISLGVGIEPADGSASPVYMVSKTVNLGAPEYMRVNNGLSISYSGVTGSMVVAFPDNLADGKYKVTVSTLADGSTDWVPVLTEASAYNYVYVTKSGASLEVESLPEAVVTLDEAELISPLYYGSVAIFTITVTNHSEKEMTNAFYPELSYNGTTSFIGDGIVLTLQPNETVTQQFTTQFRTASNASVPTSKRQYTLRWFNPNEGSTAYYDYPDEIVTLNISNSNPSVSVSKFEIVNEPTVNEEVPGIGIYPVYQIADIDNIKTAVEIKCDRGFFGYPVYFAIFNTDDLVLGESRSLMQSICEPMMPLEAGDSCEISSVSNMSSGEQGIIYAGMLFYQGQSQMVRMDADPVCFKLVGSAGVGEIEVADGAAPVYYNLQGHEVKNPKKGDLLIKRQGSKVTKIIY